MPRGYYTENKVFYNNSVSDDAFSEKCTGGGNDQFNVYFDDSKNTILDISMCIICSGINQILTF